MKRFLILMCGSSLICSSASCALAQSDPQLDQKINTLLDLALEQQQSLNYVAALPRCVGSAKLEPAGVKRLLAQLEPLDRAENFSLEQSKKLNLEMKALWAGQKCDLSAQLKLLGKNPYFKSQDLAKLTRAASRNLPYNPFRKGSFGQEALTAALEKLKKSVL